MEEYRSKSRVISNQQPQFKPPSLSPKLHLPDINIQLLFQSSFKDKQSSSRLYDLYKKYNRDIRLESKARILSNQQNQNLSLSSSNFKGAMKENREVGTSIMKKPNKNRLRMKLDRMYLECSKSVMPERDKTFESKLKGIIKGKEYLDKIIR